MLNKLQIAVNNKRKYN